MQQSTHSSSAVNTLAIGYGPLKEVCKLVFGAEVVGSHKVHHAPVLLEIVLDRVACHHNATPGRGTREGRRVERGGRKRDGEGRDRGRERGRREGGREGGKGQRRNRGREWGRREGGKEVVRERDGRWKVGGNEGGPLSSLCFADEVSSSPCPDLLQSLRDVRDIILDPVSLITDHQIWTRTTECLLNRCGGGGE